MQQTRDSPVLDNEAAAAALEALRGGGDHQPTCWPVASRRRQEAASLLQRLTQPLHHLPGRSRLSSHEALSNLFDTPHIEVAVPMRSRWIVQYVLAFSSSPPN